MYHRSFDLSEKEEIREYMKENGYVVIRGILDTEECKKTVECINKHLQTYDPGFDINNPSTYEKMHLANHYGLPERFPMFLDQLVANRVNPRVHQAYSILYGDENLIVNHDRVGIYRPTLYPGHERYKTPYAYPGLHLDMDPVMYKEGVSEKDEFLENLDYRDDNNAFISENNAVTERDAPLYQGILSILDNRAEDGGLRVVPGFHRLFDEWYEKKNFTHKPGTEFKTDFLVDDQVSMKYVHTPVRVTMERGSMAIWDKRLAHGTIPNNSSKPRIIQFINMHPKKVFTKKTLKKRNAALTKILHKNNLGGLKDPKNVLF